MGSQIVEYGFDQIDGLGRTNALRDAMRCCTHQGELHAVAYASPSILEYVDRELSRSAQSPRHFFGDYRAGVFCASHLQHGNQIWRI